jgi:hypothetical protein
MFNDDDNKKGKKTPQLYEDEDGEVFEVLEAMSLDKDGNMIQEELDPSAPSEKLTLDLAVTLKSEDKEKLRMFLENLKEMGYELDPDSIEVLQYLNAN